MLRIILDKETDARGVAAIQHVRNIRGLLRGEPYQVSVWSFGVTVTLIIAILGLVLTAYLCFWSH